MTLTEEILQNISDFKMAPFDAEANVISAHMEACLRDIQIVSECEAAGFIMEGDIIPERNDENIFKYILLFIPRLVINLLRKFREWVTGEHIPTQAEIDKLNKEEAEKAREEGDSKFLKRARDEVVSRVNQKTLMKYPNATTRLINTGDTYSCVSKMNIPNIEKAFQTYKRYYEQYTEVFEKLDSKKDISVDESITAFEKDLSYIVNVGISDIYLPVEGGINSSDISRLINGLKKDGEIYNISQEIEISMNSLIKKYHEMDTSRHVSQSNMRFASQYMSSIKVAHARFTDFSTRIAGEINAMSEMMKLVKPTSKEVFDKLKGIKDGDRNMSEILTKRGFYNGD